MSGLRAQPSMQEILLNRVDCYRAYQSNKTKYGYLIKSEEGTTLSKYLIHFFSRKELNSYTETNDQKNQALYLILINILQQQNFAPHTNDEDFEVLALIHFLKDTPIETLKENTETTYVYDEFNESRLYFSDGVFDATADTADTVFYKHPNRNSGLSTLKAFVVDVVERYLRHSTDKYAKTLLTVLAGNNSFMDLLKTDTSIFRVEAHNVGARSFKIFLRLLKKYNLVLPTATGATGSSHTTVASRRVATVVANHNTAENSDKDPRQIKPDFSGPQEGL